MRCSCHVHPRLYCIPRWVIACLGLLTLAHARSIEVVTVALDGRPEAANLEHVLASLQEAAGQRSGMDLIVTPMLPFLSFSEATQAADLSSFSAVANAQATWLAVALLEKGEAGRQYWTAVLFDRRGRIAAKYRKTHRLDGDPDFALGDVLPIHETDFGKVGLTVGTDFYFPEIYTMLALRGADVITWHHYPEPVRDHTTWRPLLLARALDNKTPLITAHYADPEPYLTANGGVGRRGSLWGRSQIINRVGITIADTGHDVGAASARLNLEATKIARPKVASEGRAEGIFFVENRGGRKPFEFLSVSPPPKPKPAYKKRKIRIAMVHSDREGNWRDEAVPRVLLSQLDEAAKLEPDVVLFSEMQANIVTEAARQTLSEISSRADAMNAYVIMAGVDPTGDAGSVAWVWDREGGVVQQKPIYWPRGHTHMETLDTDFGRIGIHVCGDLHLQELDRILALQGAEIIFDPSLMWASDGATNLALAQARAADNGVWLAVSHWNQQMPSLRTWVVDPYGQTLLGSPYGISGVTVCEVDLTKTRRWMQSLDQANPSRSPYASKWGVPVERDGWQEMIFAHRRPELYRGIGSESLP